MENSQIVATGDKLITENNDTFYMIVEGDITKDGITNIIDLVNMRKRILGIEQFDEYQQMAAELTEDKEINVKDLVRIRKIILGQEI